MSTEPVQNFDDELSNDELEELLDHAEENLTAIVLATAAYAKEGKVSFADWVQFIGSKVAPTWAEERGETPHSVARLTALNLLAGGAEIHSVSDNDSSAEIRCTWPLSEDLEFFGLTREDLDPFFDAYGPIAAELGLTYEATRNGDEVSMKYSR